MALTILTQQDFSAGMVRSVAPHLIPDNGFYDGVNLLLNSDGSPYKRGGTTYKSNANFGTSMRFVWDGILGGGQRTVFASPAKFGTLDIDDATPVDVNGTGLSAPVRPAVLLGVMYLPGGQAYGGSRRSAAYSTGTVSVQNGSKVVAGTGTTWTSNLDAGMLLRVNAAGDLYAIASVDNNTQITLAAEYNGTTASGQVYVATPALSLPSPYRSAGLYAAAFNRLVTGEGNRVYFSAIRNPSSFAATDYHELAGGVQITGLEVVMNTLLVFTTRGVWAIGNMAYNLTDNAGNPQQSLQKVNGDLILWANEGVATWGNSLIVPTVDGVWLMDSISSPTPLGLSIAPLIQSYVAAGYKPGLATVFNNHYFLPVIDQANSPVDLLVCRLDRPTRTRIGTTFPWTHWTGAGASVTALTTRTTSSNKQPVLYGAWAGNGRVIQLPQLTPDAGTTTDHDASVPSWKLITKDIATDGLFRSFTKKAKVRYEQLAVFGQAPSISLAYGTEARSSSNLWDTMIWDQDTWGDIDDVGFVSVTGTAPVNSGSVPFAWRVNRKATYMRLRLSGTGQTTRTVLRAIELFVRPGGTA